jgi:hypothetical protein
MLRGVLPIAVLAAVTGCSGAQHRADDESVQFKCRERMASYVATKHLAGDELGVLMDCDAAGPRIKRWKTDKQGNRVEDEHAIPPDAFDRAWREIDGTGWAYLKDCSNGTLDKRDPVYVFDIKDDQQKATFQCQTREVPYPYNDITDPLDVLGQKNGKQLGDDEPAELKALDRKDKQR